VAYAAALLGVAALAGVARAHPDPHGEHADAQGAQAAQETQDDDAEAVFETVAHEERAASARRLDAEAIRSAPGVMTAEDVLRLVPAVLLVQHGSEGKGQQLFMRGFDAAHGADVEVTLDDMPLNELSHVHAQGYLDLAFIIPEVIAEVRAQKGPLRAEQGLFAAAGSVSFALGVPEGLRGSRASYEVGGTNRHRLLGLYAPADQPETDFVAVEALHDDGFGQSRASQRVSVMAQRRLWEAPGSGLHLDLLALGYLARFENPGLVRLDDVRGGALGLYDSDLRDHWGHSARALLGARLGWARGDHTLDVRVYGQHRRLDLDENFTGALLYPGVGDRRGQAQRAWTPGLHLRHHWHLGSAWQWTTTARYAADLISQTEAQLDRAGSPWRRERDVSFGQHGVGLSGAALWSPGRWLSVEVGGRLDVMAFDVRSALSGGEGGGWLAQPSPRASLVARPGGGWRLFAAYGRGLRPPEARAFAPDLSPDDGQGEAQGEAQGDTEGEAQRRDRFRGGEPRATTTDSGEVGARWAPSPGVEVGAAAFGTWVARESVFDHVSGFNLSLNPTRRLGVEVDMTWALAAWLQIDLDGAYVHARFVESGAPVPGAPTLMGSAQVRVGPLEGWRASARLVALGPRALAFGATAGATARVDLSASYTWRWLEVGADAVNALNTQWRGGEYSFASDWGRGPRSQLPAIHAAAGPPLLLRGRVTLWF
jgi:outer membrane receptor protein involved in Fe transport